MSTPATIRSAVATLLVLALALLPSCGEEKDAGTAAPTPEGLAGQLLAPEDLGEGWSTPVDPSGEFDFESGVVTDEIRDKLPQIQFCDQAGAEASEAASALEWDAFRQLNLATETTEDLEPSPGTPPQHHIVFVQEFLMSDETAQVQDIYDGLAAGIEACTGEVSEYPDGETSRHLPLPVPAVGDEQVGTREVVREPGPGRRSAVWDLRNAMVRDGEVLVGITVAEITTPGIERQIDQAAFDEIVTTAVEKLG